MIKTNIYFPIKIKLFFVLLVLCFCFQEILANENLTKAIKNSNFSLISEILEREPYEVEAVDNNSRNLIQQAVYYNQPQFIPYFLEKGVKIEHSDQNGKTVLEYLVQPNLVSYFPYVLDRIENIHQKNSRLLSIGGLCVLANNLKCLELIFKKGFSPNSQEGYQLIPLLNLAYLQQFYSAVSLLLEKGANPSLQDSEGESFLHLIAKNGDVRYFNKFDSPFVDIQDRLGNTPLHLALEAKHRAFVLQILNFNPSSTLANYKGVTPFHLAAQNSNKEVLSKLFQNIIDINDFDKNGDTPLVYAVRSKNVENVRFLLERQANPNASKSNILLIASESNNLEIFSLLIDFKANPNVFTEEGKHLLVKLAEQNKKKFFDTYIEKLGIPKNLFLLHELVLLNKLPFIQTLLKYGVDIDQKNSKLETPLFEAVQSSNIEMINFLLERGANPNITNIYGETILHKAFLVRDIKLITYLLSRKVDINILDKDGNNLILKLLQSYSNSTNTSYTLEVIKLLTENGLDINFKNSSYYTALHLAIEQLNYELVNGILNLKADPNEPNKDSIYPLEAIITNYINSKMKEELNFSLIQLLLKYGANPNLKNKFGRNALSEVLANYNLRNQQKIYKVIDILLEYNVDVTQLDYEMNSALDFAKNSGDSFLISKLEKKKNKEKIRPAKEWAVVQYGTQGEDEGLALDTNKNGNHLLLGQFEKETKLFILNSRGLALFQVNAENAKGASFDGNGNIFLIGIKKFPNTKLPQCSEFYFTPYFASLDGNGSILTESLYEELADCEEMKVGNLFFSEKGFYAHFVKKENHFIYFLNSEGKKLWSKTISYPIYSTKLGFDGNLYIKGVNFQALNNKGIFLNIPLNFKFQDFIFDKKNHFFVVRNLPMSAENSLFLEKYDNKGKKLWSRFFQTDFRIDLNQIQVDAEDSVYLAGVTAGSLHNQPKLSRLDTDIFLIKLDSNGKRLWTIQFGSDGDEVIKGMQVTKDKNILVLATSYGKVQGATHQGLGDIVLFKINEEGEEF